MEIVEIKTPDLGGPIKEATLSKIFKKVGDAVKKDETICELSTDKAVFLIVAPANGIINQIYFHEESNVVSGQTLVEIAVAPFAHLATDSQETNISNRGQETTEQSILTQQSSLGLVTPEMARMLQKYDVDFATMDKIEGTGHQGRIKKQDLKQFLENQKTAADPTKIKPMDPLQKLAAEKIVLANRTIPQVTCFKEIDVSSLIETRREMMTGQKPKNRGHLTLTAFFTLGIAKALEDFPILNSSVSGDSIVIHDEINIGLVTDNLEGNLAIPVIKNANKKTLEQISVEIDRLKRDARTKQLKIEDVQGSTFTVSNAGTFGSLMGTPIVNPPNVGILALGQVQRRTKVILVNGTETIAIRDLMYLSFSFDHRIINGSVAEYFLNRIEEIFTHSESFESSTNNQLK